MGVTRAAVLVCAVLCSAARAEPAAGELDGTDGAHDDPKASRVSHRVQLLFPLLLRISTRLATLVPTAVMGLIGIFLFVAFSKKAFIISLLALFLTYLDKYKRDDDVIHIHKINLYDGEEVLAHNEEHLHYGGGWPVRKRFSVPHGFHGPYYPHGYWPAASATTTRFNYQHRPRWPPPPRHSGPPPSLAGLRRTWLAGNRTVPSDFDEFLSQSLDSGPNSVRYL